MIDRLKRSILAGASIVVLTVMLSSSCDMMVYASEQSRVEMQVETSAVQPRSAIIEYRYKVVNGDVYRRLYNYTEQCWIGDWVLYAKGN